MEAAVFFRLAFRLPAYRGVMAAVVARESREQDGPRRPASRQPARYERSSAMANNARAAEAAPPATAGQLATLNAQLGSQWFSHQTVPSG
jgi:hypothetical protein